MDLEVLKRKAYTLYNECGEEVDDPIMSISLLSHKDHLSDHVHTVIMEVLEECQLGFPLQDFQMVALHIIGSSRDLVLVAPTGSGKMLVIFLGIMVLSTILMEKLDSTTTNGPFKVGVLTMDGECKTEDNDINVKLSHNEEKFVSGELLCLMGHAESWNSPVGKRIIRKLKEKNIFLLFFVDEFHQGLSNHWAEIRPEMRNVPSAMQIHKHKQAASVVMSATTTGQETGTMIKEFALVNSIILKENPVQSHFNFQVIERPPSLYHTSGQVDSKGNFHHGLETLLNILYLDYFVANPLIAKKAIIFFRTEQYLMDINDILSERLPDYVDPFTQPWVQCHSGVGEVTEGLNYRRRNEITLFLSTSKMLMGIDLKSIEVIIFVRPLNMIHYILQGAGRGGRKNTSGKRKKVLVYILYNKSDIADNVPGMSTAVKEFLLSKRCLKTEMSEYFGFFHVNGGEKSWCCSNCN